MPRPRIESFKVNDFRLSNIQESLKLSKCLGLLVPPGASWCLLGLPGASWGVLAPPGASWGRLGPPGLLGRTGASRSVLEHLGFPGASWLNPASYLLLVISLACLGLVPLCSHYGLLYTLNMEKQYQCDQLRTRTTPKPKSKQKRSN